jgi:all-trans-8'-apo-beta-carotenal 15,15'-oxygenase
MNITTLLSRRSAITAMGVSAINAAVPAWAAGCDSPFASFNSKLAEPWTLGFANMAKDVAPMALRVRGRIPEEALGSLYRNGPGRYDLGDVRYAHWFDGDGALQRYNLTSKGIQHEACLVRTAKLAADNAAGKFVRQGFGTRLAEMPPAESADSINVANTSVVHHGGRLLTLWEGGSAHEMDAQTLQTKGLHRWSDDTAGLPFSAHPRIDTDGTMWNFGASSLGGGLVIYRIGKDGKLITSTMLRVPDMAMVHDFAVTQNHLVFLLPPLIYQASRYQSGQSFSTSHVWTPTLGLRVMVLPKNQPDKPKWYELPSGMVFHIGNACEDSGIIRLDCMRAPSSWYAHDGKLDLMCGNYQPQEHPQAMLVELDMNSQRARQTVLPLVAEFPSIDRRFVGQPYKFVFAAIRQSSRPNPSFDSIARLNVTSGAVDSFNYGDDFMVEEHLFIPRKNRSKVNEGAGFLIGTALDTKKRQVLLSIFDAQNLATGPLMQATMDRPMPLGFHGCHVGASA